MILFRSGKPRAGKTYYAVERDVVAELRKPVYEMGKDRDGRDVRVRCRRVIVTNVSLFLDELQEFLPEVHVVDWVFFIDRKEMEFFYRHRGNGVMLPMVKRADGLEEVDFSGLDPLLPSVLFVLDEIHLVFNQHQWEKIGAGGDLYLSQHAKLGDDVVAITQFVGKVAKPFRVLGQSFTYCRNERLERVGWAKRSNSFVARTFMEIQTKDGEAPSYKEIFTFDPAIGRLYDTSAGVGVDGGLRADVGREVKRPTLLLFVIVGFVVCLGLLGSGLYWALHRHASAKSTVGVAVGLSASPQKQSVGAERPGAAVSAVSASADGEASRGESSAGHSGDVLHWVTFVRSGDRWTLSLDNGKVLGGSDPIRFIGSVAEIFGDSGVQRIERHLEVAPAAAPVVDAKVVPAGAAVTPSK